MMNQDEAMTVAWYGGMVARRSWFGSAVVYLDNDEILVKLHRNMHIEIYDQNDDLGSDDWETIEQF